MDPSLLASMQYAEMRDMIERAAAQQHRTPVNWPPLALSGEASVAGIRRSPRPVHHPIIEIPIPTKCPPLLRLEGADPDMEEAMYCMPGGRLVNQVYEVMVDLINLNPHT